MKATLLLHQAPGGARTPLEESLPLSTPYVVQFFPIYACNFTCKYCHFSIPKAQRCFVTDTPVMDIELYRKCLDDMTAFPEKIRTLRFVGIGEPLLHRDIDSMVRLAKEKQVANTVEMLTNASLLTHAMSQRLIDAGLDRLVISLQGVNARKYRETSAVDLDFDAFVEQIAWFHAHKTHTHVYCKVVDIALDGKEDRKRYLEIFGDISDSIGIESAVPIYTDVPLNAELAKKAATTQYGTALQHSRICPQPFYILQINPDGKVVGCHSLAYPEILGDCTKDSIPAIWNGERYNAFRRRMLKGMENVCDVCAQCTVHAYRTHPEDVIRNENGRLDMSY